MVVENLYRNATSTPESSFVFDDTALKAALKRIYEKDYNPMTEIDEKLFNSVWKTLNKATDEGFASAGNRDADFKEELKYNNAVFSAFKVHRLQNDVAAQLIDDKGNLKSYNQWRADTQDIVSHQTENWLETEYNTAVIRAHQAADWRQFLREADILPNLKWNKSTSLEPGKDHMIFWNRIWSVKSNFWEKHRPGDRWGCKCSLSSTDEPETDNSDVYTEDSPAAPGLAGNPGETGKIFSDDHPYIEEAHKGAKKAVQKLLNNLDIAKEKVKEKTFKSGGVLQIPKDLNQTPAEKEKNLQAYTELAKMHGGQYKLLPIKNEAGHKNPDAVNLKTGYYSDMKNPQTDNGKNAIQASIKAASKQKVGEVYIYMEKEYPRSTVYAGLKAALQGGRAKSIKEIIIRYPDGEIKRYDADKLREVLKNIGNKS